MTDEVGQFRLRGAVHLISRLRRQLPLIGEAIGVPRKKVQLIKISIALFIDCRYLNATAYRSDVPYQAARTMMP